MGSTTVARTTICQSPPPPSEPPEGESPSTPNDIKAGELTTSLSKKPKEEVSVTGMGYHGDGSLATVHLLQPIPEEDKPRVMSKRRTTKRVTIGRDRRRGECAPVSWSMRGSSKLVSMATQGIVGGPVSEADQLRSWFAKEVEGYGLVVRDLGPASFADGLALCAVLHRYLPRHM